MSYPVILYKLPNFIFVMQEIASLIFLLRSCAILLLVNEQYLNEIILISEITFIPTFLDLIKETICLKDQL